MQQDQLIIHTDGSAGRDGSGGWAALIHSDDIPFVYTGGGASHTNNAEMELKAVTEAIAIAMNQYPDINYIHIVSDSKYVVDGLSTHIHAWKRNGWKTASNKPLAHPALWKQIVKQMQECNISASYVKAHNGQPENELVDAGAKQFRQEFLQSQSTHHPR